MTEVTNIEKNIAIAEMLGAKRECYYHNVTSGYKIEQMVGDCMTILRKHSYMPVGSNITSGINVEFLEFHTNANWQFEAFDWIERLGKYYIGIDYHNRIGTTVLIGEENGNFTYQAFLNISLPNKKEAIFEALYQFSQYLKQK